MLAVAEASKDGQYGFQPGCGWLPVDWMDAANVQRSLRQLSRNSGTHLVDYSQAGGYVQLRQQLVRRLEETGMRAEVPQIVTFHSAFHGLDLVCRLMLRPSDKVLIDDPAYFNLFGMLKLFGPRCWRFQDLKTVQTFQPCKRFWKSTNQS